MSGSIPLDLKSATRFSPSARSAFSGLVAVAVLFFARVRFEEQMMIETFGEDYRRYMQETKRIVPGIY